MRALETLERFHFLFDLVEVMHKLNALSDRICELLQCLNLFGNLCILVSSVNFEHRKIQCLEIRHVFVNFIEVMRRTINIVNWPNKLLQVD